MQRQSSTTEQRSKQFLLIRNLDFAIHQKNDKYLTMTWQKHIINFNYVCSNILNLQSQTETNYFISRNKNFVSGNKNLVSGNENCVSRNENFVSRKQKLCFTKPKSFFSKRISCVIKMKKIAICSNI